MDVLNRSGWESSPVCLPWTIAGVNKGNESRAECTIYFIAFAAWLLACLGSSSDRPMNSISNHAFLSQMWSDQGLVSCLSTLIETNDMCYHLCSTQKHQLHRKAHALFFDKSHAGCLRDFSIHLITLSLINSRTSWHG